MIVDNIGIILQIACAIEQRDQELAELLMRRHISGAWKIVKTILKEPYE